MCLDRIRPDMNRFKSGWKMFGFSANELYTLCQGNDHKPLPENKWIHYKAWSVESGEIGVIENDDVFYPQGWHVEATLKGVEGWKGFGGETCLRKVLCRDMHTTGRQDGNKVGVCYWIKILPEPEVADG